MAHDLLALAAFALVTSITPGPNNLMLLASGANFGFARTVPHMLGISGGMAILLFGVGTGLMRLFEAWPVLQQALRFACLGYLMWLAWRIARAARPEGQTAGARPMTAVEAAAFQWVNPKAWAMAMTAVTLYAPAQTAAAIVPVALIFSAINLPSVSLWAAAGRGLGRVLDRTGRLRAFNWAMAALLVAATLPMI